MEKEASVLEEILSGDKEYIDEYFKICALYQKKRSIFSKAEKDQDKENKTADSKPLSQGIEALNLDIKEKEKVFWRKVDSSLAQGAKFTAEEFASSYELDPLEKKILLFFFYLEFIRPWENKCYEDVLLSIFDLEDSPLWRMQNFRYLWHDARLMKNAIIFKDYENISCSARAIFSLSGDMIKNFSKMFNGEKVELATAETKSTRLVDEVGFTKEPEYTLDNVILKHEVKERLLFFLESRNHEQLDRLGVFDKIKKAKGMNFLFYGSPGTGKSILAEAVAAYLKKKILVVEVPKIFNQHVGETDKKISRMFKAAKQNDLVLCIDEADSLFYNRSFAFQEHDIRFVNDMLQELERFEGVAVFTTNMEGLLDEALERRISFRVKLELPDEKLRSQIWASHIPHNVKLAQDINFMAMAQKYEFSGGYIKNAVMNAVRRIALKNQDIITMEDLAFGADMEYEGIFNKENRKGAMGFEIR